MQKSIGLNPSDKDIEDFVKNLLKSGRVVPGYGHAVLRNTDPRFLH
jgi:citrate synthase